jgi:signal transduction histidine kinase
MRAPLTRLKGYVDLLQSEALDGGLSPDLLDETLRRMSRAVDSAAGLIKRLTDPPTLLSHQLEAPRHPLELWRLVTEVAMQYPEVSVVQIDTAGVVDGDSERLEQVLINLLENTRKYSPKGSGVRVLLRSIGDGVLLQVEDQGIGVPSGANEAIFGLFQRAANALALQIPGQGMGLYICRQIVQQHGGNIWAESEGEGRGTTFNVWLPRSE